MIQPMFAMLPLLVLATIAVPISSSPISITTELPGKVSMSVPPRMKPKKVDFLAPASPYRFKLPATARADTSSIANIRAPSVDTNLAQVLSKSSASSVVNPEKNWLLTKAWLIDNINRLRRELSELERDYSQHLDTTDRVNTQKEKQFIEDITKLRADHTVLSQQQKQIIYLIKRNQMLRGKPFSENDIHYVPLNTKVTGKPTKMADSHIKRQVKRDLTQSLGSENFETQTRHNMKEVFGQLSALHDLTLNLFADMRSIEHKLENRNKFQ